MEIPVLFQWAKKRLIRIFISVDRIILEISLKIKN